MASNIWSMAQKQSVYTYYVIEFKQSNTTYIKFSIVQFTHLMFWLLMCMKIFLFFVTHNLVWSQMVLMYQSKLCIIIFLQITSVILNIKCFWSLHTKQNVYTWKKQEIWKIHKRATGLNLTNHFTYASIFIHISLSPF